VLVSSGNCRLKGNKPACGSRLIAGDDLAIEEIADHRCESTSTLRRGASGSAAPLHFQAIYVSFDQIFMYVSRVSDRLGGTSKKAEQHNTHDVSAVHRNLCCHLQEYTSGIISFCNTVLQVALKSCARLMRRLTTETLGFLHSLQSYHRRNHNFCKYFVYRAVILRFIPSSSKVKSGFTFLTSRCELISFAFRLIK
jgi:hypothetical protein